MSSAGLASVCARWVGYTNILLCFIRGLCLTATLPHFVFLLFCLLSSFPFFLSGLFAYRFASVASFLSVISLLVTVSRMAMNVSLLVVTVHYDVSGIIVTMVRLVVTVVVLVVTVSCMMVTVSRAVVTISPYA